MALTPVEETKVRELLTVQEELLDLGAESTNILAEIGGTDTTVPALPAATSVNLTDKFYAAQGANDRHVTAQQISDAIINPHLAASDPHPQYLTMAEGDARYAQAFVGTFTTKVILTAASGNFTVPAGVIKIRAYAIGKGADGAAGVAGVSSGAGGAGGGCAWGDITVTAGQVIPYGAGLNSALSTFLYASGATGSSSPGSGAISGVTNGGTATGGNGGAGASGAAVCGGGGAASGSPLGTGGNGAGGGTSGGGGGGWGGNGSMGLGNPSYGAGTGGNASADGPSASAGVWSNTIRGAIGRTQFSAYTDLLLAPCTGALNGANTGGGWSVINGAGTGGTSQLPPTYGGGAGSDSPGNQARRFDSVFGGGAGGAAAAAYTGGNAGFGGGGGGGAATGGTAGGTGGAGCIVIFY